MAEMISILEFAKRKKIHRKAVQDAIVGGRIKTTKMKQGHPKINWDTQSQAWEDNRDLSNLRNIPDTSPGAQDSNINNFAKAKTVRETLTAKILQLDYEERMGKLVNADEVKTTWFNIARSVRDGMLNIPDRLAAELAAENDEFKVHTKLKAEIFKQLEILSHGSEE